MSKQSSGRKQPAPVVKQSKPVSTTKTGLREGKNA